MTRVFDLEGLPGVPGPGRRAVLLTARVDLDIATEHAALAQLREVVADAVLIDLGRVFSGVTVVRCLGELASSSPAVAVVGAPRWLVELAPRLALPPLPYASTVDSAVAALRTRRVERG